jgi:hypothetical protein
MDDNAPLRALLGAVDHMLTDQGVNPAIVTDEDKILLAAQYVETAAVQEKIAATTLPEDQIRARLFDTAS